MTTHRIALVLGATGGIGGEVARRLAAGGWTIRALSRHAALPASGFHWIRGDALSARDVADAATGVSLIVHAVNPSRYRHWDRLVLPMLDNTIAAARSVGARILFPGTVYNYGPDALPYPAEDSPQHPTTRKGLIRAEMERRLRAASANGVRVLIVRAGDYFGPRLAGSSWFSQVLVKAGQPVSAITNPGRPGIGHQWAYLPDVAETMVQLLERGEGREAFQSFQMQGHWDADGTAMVDAIRRAIGRPDVKVRSMPWGLIRLASPFVPLFRELTEIRYLWETPLHMSNARLVEALGAEPHTPLDLAVRATLIGLGCLENQGEVSPSAESGQRRPTPSMSVESTV